MATPSVDHLARSFERCLRAGNKSPRTIETYLEAVNGFDATWWPAPSAGWSRPAGRTWRRGWQGGGHRGCSPADRRV